MIGFHNSYVKLFESTQKYSQSTLNQARNVLPGKADMKHQKYVATSKLWLPCSFGVESNMNSKFPGWASRVSGSDNIYVPLREIYQTPQKTGYLTQIFTMTDGNVQSCHVSKECHQTLFRSTELHKLLTANFLIISFRRRERAGGMWWTS